MFVLFCKVVLFVLQLKKNNNNKKKIKKKKKKKKRLLTSSTSSLTHHNWLTVLSPIYDWFTTVIINGRPSTKVSDNPRDPEALTPNHLLLLRSGPTLSPGVFAKEDRYSRQRWRHVQYLTDVFWRRWIQ